MRARERYALQRELWPESAPPEKAMKYASIALAGILFAIVVLTTVFPEVLGG